ncbi:hypothetical protein RhiirC2_777474 [Rhizophagus irregularis]|uniref:Zinc finger bed domain-containing protein ricesleeper 2-like n=1 Tax=Rhizophagus irregularis TaxID=588596 RepID=A0A2N1NED0_9GLOM|nr:hypothetical protein RhiirC2_777474 [Rhizophagus irregularis]
MKKLRNTKITDFAKPHHPHLKHIQKQRKESMLKWMLITDQPISTVTNSVYKEKISNFDLFFIIPEEQKVKIMISKSYNYNRENLKNLLNEMATSVSLTTDLWSSRAKHEYLGIAATWITTDFKIS